MFTQAQFNAFGRNVLSGIGGAAGMFVALHQLSGSDAGTITQAATMIWNGLGQIYSGVLLLTPLALGAYASWTASHHKQLASVQKAIDSGALQGVAIVKTEPAATQQKAGQ